MSACCGGCGRTCLPRILWITWIICEALTTCIAATLPPDSLRLTLLSNSSLVCNDASPAGSESEFESIIAESCSTPGMKTKAIPKKRKPETSRSDSELESEDIPTKPKTKKASAAKQKLNRYYIRRGSNSEHWVVYLEGGGYCWDTASCGARWRRRPGLMSSTRWPRARRAPALLSSDPTANPLWHASNHVLLPYCSSDMWAGTRTTRNGSFVFAGRLIVRAVLAQLLHVGLSGRLLLVGSSAGGAGVLFHADAARRMLRPYGIRVAAVADSGWFLDRPARTRRASSADTVARLGHSLWRGSPPTSCVREHPQKPWLCYFGYRLYPHIRTPLFVFQYLFDSAQLAAEGVRAPRNRAQWDAVHDTGSALRDSLKMVRATFAPACLAHGALARPEWLSINVSGISLPRALGCWERRLWSGGGAVRRKGGCAPRRLIERCSWPQCNGSCPRLRDPRTGEEVALAALLQSFGLDVRGAAAAMGLDARALTRMSHSELLSLLASHA